VLLLRSTLTLWRRASKSNSTFLIFAVLVVWCRPCRQVFYIYYIF